jgi:Family of unknown function (DUF6481)
MGGFKYDDHNDRREASAKAKQAMLEKFRARQRPAAPAAPEGAPEPDADGASEAGGKAPHKAGKTRK